MSQSWNIDTIVPATTSPAEDIPKLTDALRALRSNFSGATWPSPTSVGGQVTLDTTNKVFWKAVWDNSKWMLHASDDGVSVVTKTATFSPGVRDFTKTFICTGTWAATFAAAATLTDGWYATFRNDGTGIVTLDPNASETIDGVASIQLAPQESCIVSCDGALLKTTGCSSPNAQIQMATAFTSAGTSTAYTLTPVPALAALAANQRFRVNFHAASGANPTLAISGLASKNLKQYNSAGTKVSAVVAAGQLVDVEYDGTDYVLLGALPVGNGGATETTGAVDITLTSTSSKVQAVLMTVANKSVALPDATTMTTGGALFVVKNTGTLPFAVRNSAGTAISFLASGQIALFYLTNNGTAAGTWAVGNESTDSFLGNFYAGATLSVNAVASSYMSVTAMSATQAIVTYAGASGYLYACTLDVSGATITAGTPLQVNAVAVSFYTSVTKLSSTQAIVAYTGTTGYVNACTLNVSGTTITAGTILVVNAVASAYVSCTGLSATQAVVAYQATGTLYLNACTLNVSGTTLTAGAIVAGAAVVSYFMAVTKLSSTQAIAVCQGPTQYLNACTINISGTTVTIGTLLVVNAEISNNPSCIGLSTTQAVVIYQGAVNLMNAFVLSVSGTTVTAGAEFVGGAMATSGNSGNASVTTLSAAQVLATYQGASGYLNTCTLNVSGTTLTLGDTLVVNAVSSPYNTVAALTFFKHIVVYRGTSTYLQTCTLEPIP